MAQRYTIEFQPSGKRVEADVGTTVLEASRAGGIDIATACGGLGSCGLCRVEILTGKVDAVTEKERLLFSRHRQEGERLSCCVRPRGDLRVHIPNSSLAPRQRLQLDADANVSMRVRGAIAADAGQGLDDDASEFPVDPRIHRHHVRMAAPTLNDPRADFSRLREALKAQHGLRTVNADIAVVRSLPALARGRDWDLHCYIHGDELLGITEHPARTLGMAVDQGTTKIAAYLLDLDSGELLASVGAPNPQIGYGEDVVSRLTYAQRNTDGARTLAHAVGRVLNDLLGELVEKAGASREEVVDLCIVGNTAVVHLMLELPVRQLATTPFVAAVEDAIDIKARDLGIAAAAGAYVHIPPCIGGFVGADHVAMILASGIDRCEHVVIGIDIGTNTEIVLHGPAGGAMVTLSCPSGPAFEGAHISDGMRAAAGAIERVWIEGEDIRLKTIDDAPPIGLCGSGIIDAVAALRREGIINSRGRLQKGSTRVREGDCGPEFLLVPAADAGGEHDILIRQTDINEIQLAKGAVCAAIAMILEHTSTLSDSVEEIVIAGAFGSFLDIESAIDIALLPYFENARYTQVGNAAGRGAQLALLSSTARARARRIALETEYLELTVIDDFTRRFARATLLPDDDALARRHDRTAGPTRAPREFKPRSTA